MNRHKAVLCATSAFAIALFVGIITAMAPGPAHAQSPSGSVAPLPSDTSLVLGQEITVFLRVENTSQNMGAPSNADLIAGAMLDVYMACTSGACTTTLPGTISFVSQPTASGCVDAVCTSITNQSAPCSVDADCDGTLGSCSALPNAGSIASCAVDLLDPNRVVVTTSAPITFGTSPPPASPASIQTVAAIRLKAEVPIATPTDGSFFTRSECSDCLAVDGATAGAEGSTQLFFPALCGDNVVSAPETCDPPGSQPRAADTCFDDACGNTILGVCDGDLTTVCTTDDDCPDFCDGLPTVTCTTDTECQVQSTCRGATDSTPCSYCGDGVVDAADGEACDDGNNINDDDCSNTCQLGGCAVDVEKDACVQFPGGSCEGQAQAVVLQYIGPNIEAPVTVIFGSSFGSSEVYSLPSLMNGDILTSPAQNGYSLDSTTGGKSWLGPRIVAAIGSEFELLHTSCSCPEVESGNFNLVVGEPMCLEGGSPDNPTGLKGEPSPLWKLVGLKDGALGQLGDPGACISELPGAPTKPHCKGKIEGLRVRYEGGGCANSEHDQKDFACTEFAGFDPSEEPVRIVVTDGSGGTIWLDTGSPADVALGDVLDIVAANAGSSSLGNDTLFQILDASDVLIEEFTISTACKKNRQVNAGDLFGGLLVASVTSSKKGTVSACADVEYSYTVTNTGSSDITGMTILDDQLGVIPPPSLPLGAGQTAVVTETALVCGPVTNNVLVTGSPGGCTAEDSASITMP